MVEKRVLFTDAKAGDGSEQVCAATAVACTVEAEDHPNRLARALGLSPESLK